jgi:hypothetical protein
MRSIILGALALLMCGCGTTRQFVPPISIAKIPPELKQACVGVVNIPDRDLTVAEAARLWSIDRIRLATCARRQGALSKAISVQEDGK